MSSLEILMAAWRMGLERESRWRDGGSRETFLEAVEWSRSK